MKLQKISDQLSIAEQPALADIRFFAGAGFTKLINNRPENEEETQPQSSEEEAAARAAGLQYAHIPVVSKAIKESDVRAFQSSVRNAVGPVIAHCKSGTRPLVLWSIGEVLEGRIRRDELRAFGDKHGYDLSAAISWLERHEDGATQPEG
jgi:uncharacterized protein (TIGR01244 family)